MERLSDAARGYAVIKVVGGYPEEVLNRCAENCLEFWGVRSEDECTLFFRTRLENTEKVESFSAKTCCDIETTQRHGLPLKAKRLRRRYVLWLLPVILCLGLVFFSLFIWQIDITGNESVTDTQIRNALEDSGVYCGSFRPTLRADLIRTRVLMRVPELKWAGVQVFGSRVVLQVREAVPIPELFDRKEPIRLIASRAGLIQKVSALSGKSVFENGQTAVDGETLIDGIIPANIDGDTRIVHAKGTVVARTWYEMTAIMPLKYCEKEYTGKNHSQYALIIGTKRINFYRSSRILDGSCDIIIKEYKVGIPGFFSVPVTLLRQTALGYETAEQNCGETEMKTKLSEALTSQLRAHIGEDGTVSEQNITFAKSDGYAIATLRAECVQNIAKEQAIDQSEIDEAKAKDEEEQTPDD